MLDKLVCTIQKINRNQYMSAQCLCLNNKFYLSSRFDHLAAALLPDTLRSFAIEFDCLVTRQFERILGQPEDTLRAVWGPVAAEHAHESEDDDERFDYVRAVRLGLPLSRGGAGRKTLLAKSPILFLGAFLRQFCRHLCAKQHPRPVDRSLLSQRRRP